MLPLAQMVARGKGSLRLPIRVRRRDYCEVELERAKVDIWQLLATLLRRPRRTRQP